MGLVGPRCSPLVVQPTPSVHQHVLLQRSSSPSLLVSQAYQSSPSLSSPSSPAKLKVLELLAAGHDSYNPGDLAASVEEMLLSSPTPKEQLATSSFKLGQGTWEVFWAPHIAGMSGVLGTRFQPIQYVLNGSDLWSYVKFSNPLLGSGWLNAAGSMQRKSDDTLSLNFDRFWVDPESALRRDVPKTEGFSLQMDAIIGSIGRAAFFSDLALFPVLYLDDDMAVFEFPPLKSKIACRKVMDQPMLPP